MKLLNLLEPEIEKFVIECVVIRCVMKDPEDAYQIQEKISHQCVHKFCRDIQGNKSMRDEPEYQ